MHYSSLKVLKYFLKHSVSQNSEVSSLPILTRPWEDQKGIKLPYSKHFYTQTMVLMRGGGGGGGGVGLLTLQFFLSYLVYSALF